MADNADEAVGKLEQVLRSDEEIEPQRAADLAELLEAAEIRDLVELVERTTPVRAAVVLRLLSRRRSIAVFDALDAAHQADLVGALSDAGVYEFFNELDPEDRVALLDELPAEIAERMLRGLPANERDITGVVLGYPKKSIGRRMSPEVPMVGQDLTAGEALTQLRRQSDDVETIYTVPIIAPDRRLVGVTSLRALFTAEQDTPIGELSHQPVFANAHDDAEETSRWYLPLDLLALPIVDDSQRLVGILTFDDAVDVMEEADSEDSARAGASEPLQQPYLTTPLLKIVRSRIVWLLILAVSALLTVQVLDTFEDALAAAVVLSLFIPLLTGTGGNTGNQAATTVTRALALGDVRKRDILEVMWRELRVGLVLGLVLGVLGFALLSLFYGVQIGTVIGLTLFAVCTMAATVGGMMPIIAKWLGADPAVFSNPFITTFVDAAGLIVYFLIAKAVLGI